MYKARYVAKGFAQIKVLDFFETYELTCKQGTFRTLLALQHIKIYISVK